ncbi:MAG: valine--tRNA ligase [Planctomycetota bacterium]|nr:valine--tRNA ligase [Planctomycetota bacterium]
MPTDAGRAPPPTMPPKYLPADHEPAIRARWEASRAFHADPERVLGGEALPYTIVIPPPNVTAALHLGHALNNTLQDVLIRARRMMGFEALWLPGTDHAGIATQTVVEKRVMAEEGKRRTDFSRAEFVAKVQAFKDDYEAKITEQLKRMGCSCDWERQRFTMDELCARAVREAFFRLFKDGLIYRGKRLVNWDPVTQTALADDEVEMREVEGKFYYLRYPLIHPPQNPSDPKDAQEVTWGELATRGYPGAQDHDGDDNAWVTVATTRPETYLGDTGVALNPDDPRAKPLKGLMVQLPIVGRVIPIVEDSYVVMADPESCDAKAKYATGFLKVTPAHDQNDYLIGMRHELPTINVMAPDASISDQHGWDREHNNEGGHVFLGKSREEARELVVKEFRARNLLEQVKPYTHSVGHSYRSHAAIEPYLSDQWYVAVTNEKLRGAALHAMAPDQRTTDSFLPRPVHDGDGELRFHPERYAKTFEQWHEGLRDWCISRQLWWGHRIPVWSMLNSEFLASGHLDTLERTYAGKYAVCGTDGESDAEVVYICAKPDDELEAFLEGIGAQQDPDVLDTWFSSALWPMSTMGWPGVPDAPVASTLAPNDPDSLLSIYVKRFGTWQSFIGDPDARSGEVVERLLSLRDHEPTKPIAYELFSESDLTTPLRAVEDIRACDDLVCAVGVRTRGTISTQKFGDLDTGAWLRSHGFVDSSTTRLLEAFNPTSVLTTAREIITLWVSRMVMFNRYFLGKSQGAEGQARTDGRLPFKDVFIHAMIQDGSGQKMSKSLGNGVDPIDIIESHGSDAMRFTLVKMTTQTQDVRMPVDLVCPHCEKTFEPKSVKSAAGHAVAMPEQKCPGCKKPMVTAFGVFQGIKPTAEKPLARNTSSKFDEARNFCNKLWNASRFALRFLEGDAAPLPLDKTPGEMVQLPDRWILSRLAETIAECEKALSSYQFSVYATSLYDFLWRDFCDWYLEAIKPTIESHPLQRSVLAHVLDATIRLLHPIAPFVTEAIWEHLRDVKKVAIEGIDLAPPREGGLLATAGWPRVDDSWKNADAEAMFARVQGLVSAIREVRAQHQVPPKRRITLHAPEEVMQLIALTEPIVSTLAGLEGCTHDEPEGPSVPARFEGHDLRLSNLVDAVDAGAERERLAKTIAANEKQAKAIEGRLSNPGYAEKAPAHLVEQSRKQLADLCEEIASLRAQLEQLA